jgi:hypothetical protein
MCTFAQTIRASGMEQKGVKNHHKLQFGPQTIRASGMEQKAVCRTSSRTLMANNPREWHGAEDSSP